MVRPASFARLAGLCTLVLLAITAGAPAQADNPCQPGLKYDPCRPCSRARAEHLEALQNFATDAAQLIDNLMPDTTTSTIQCQLSQQCSQDQRSDTRLKVELLLSRMGGRVATTAGVLQRCLQRNYP